MHTKEEVLRLELLTRYVGREFVASEVASDLNHLHPAYDFTARYIINTGRKMQLIEIVGKESVSPYGTFNIYRVKKGLMWIKEQTVW